MYGAAKAGAAHLLRHIAREVGPLGVTANVIHEAGITLFSALYGHDFTSENTLLTTLDIDKLTSDKIILSG